MKTSIQEIMQDSVKRWAKGELDSESNWRFWKQPPGNTTGKPAADAFAERHGLTVRNSAIFREHVDMVLNQMRDDRIRRICNRYGVEVKG